MIQKLRIQNYAIIDELVIQFSHNLNIITGETGAGKSILMGALDLVLGKRADIAVLKNKEKKCIVEATFLIKNNDAVNIFFIANDLDTESEIIIRREIAANGKSRSFVNDTPVSLTQLKELAHNLVDLHRQFDTQEISTENFQKEVLDALADNGNLLAQLKFTFAKYTQAKNELEKLKNIQANANKEADYNTFLLNEFNEINLQPNELENLDAEIKLLTNAENIKIQLSNIYTPLINSEEPIVQNLKAFAQKLNGLKEYHVNIEELQKRLQSAQVEIQDIANELETIDDNIIYDAERINTVNDRISAGYTLQKKHGVVNTAQLLEIQETLQQKLDAVFNITATIEKLEKENTVLFEEANKIAATISTNRIAQIKPFVQKVNALLIQVGMPNAQIKVEIKPIAISQTGFDEINFLFDANKSNRFEPLHKVASGGELSRLMLSVKSLVAQKLQLPVLIFDEIDTGISGEAAKQVGIIMKNLSASHQLIVISHQPQIAAKADAHYFVFKEIVKDSIQTSVRLLNNNERIVAIAQMLGGEKPTAAAIENAKEMMN
ncbi:MAG: DNA repair protein RecN [Ferruginibacter sp.]|nr:DNA repair protein RecN [Ferruginibacter sp.]